MGLGLSAKLRFLSSLSRFEFTRFAFRCVIQKHSQCKNKSSVLGLPISNRFTYTDLLSLAYFILKR